MSGPSERVDARPAVYCAVTAPLSWSPRDTDATIAEIKHADAARARLCGVTKP